MKDLQVKYKPKLPYTQIAYNYAQDVVSGRRLEGKLVIGSCRRWLKFLDRKDMWADEEDLHDYCDLVESMKHVNGRHFILEPWQVFLMAGIFLFRWESDNTRVTTTIYHSVARKNGKSAIAGAISNANNIYENPNDFKEPEVIITANSKEQGKILFSFVSGYASSLDPQKKIFNVFTERVHNTINKGNAVVLAADAKKLDGYGASLFFIDEFHEATDSSVYDVMVSGQGVREEPLGGIITTRGFNPMSVCKEFEDNYITTLDLDGDGDYNDDPTIFTLIYSLDDDDDWRDPKNWPKANPNLGVTVKQKYLEAQFKKALNFGGTSETNFKVKNLNMWVDGDDIWIDDEVVMNHSREIEWSEFKNLDVDIGVDLSETEDLTSVTFHAVKDGDHLFKTLAYIPKGSLKKRKRKAMWEQWVEEGQVIAIDGDVIDYRKIIDDIEALVNRFDMTVQDILYDPYNAAQFILMCEDRGWPTVECRQNFALYNRPLKEFYRLMMGFGATYEATMAEEEAEEEDGGYENDWWDNTDYDDDEEDFEKKESPEIASETITIDSNKVTRYNFRCVRILTDPSGKYARPVKDSTYHKIDIICSTLMSFGGWLHRARSGTDNVY